MADMDNDFDWEIDIEYGKKQRPSQAGRKLVRWNPDIDQFVLLAVDIVCTEQGTPVPWDCVAEKLNEYVSGEGIKQHLAKVRKYREQNGRRVPHKSAHKSGRVGGRKVSMQDTDFHQRTPKKKGRDDRLAPATGKGASLLWTDPRAKVPRQPKEVGEDAGETEKQKSKEGRKKAANTENTVEVSKTPPKKSRPSTGKAEEFEGNNNIKKTKSTGRRGRTKRDLVIKDEDEAECLGTGSPIKRERNLRTTYAVNYDETQMLGELDEDIFDAQNYDDVDGDEGYDEPTHGFQSAAVRKSANAPSHISYEGTCTPEQQPSNFDTMLHSRTGTHAYSREIDDQDSNFKVFTGANNSYGSGQFPGEESMCVNGGGMMVIHGSQFNSPPQHVPDQLPIHAQGINYGGFGEDQQTYGGRGDGAPVRKARRQTSRRKEDDGGATPLSKKHKKKDHDSTKQSKKEKIEHKTQRKNSVQNFSFAGDEQRAAGKFFTEDNFLSMDLQSETELGASHTFGAGMPGTIIPLNTQSGQRAAKLTASPTAIDYSFFSGLPLPPSTYGINSISTGITPQFNTFTFGDSSAGSNNHNAGLAMPSTEFNVGGESGFNNFDFSGADSMSNYTTNNGSFSSSNGMSTVGSQSDQVLPGIYFGADAGGIKGAGLGLDNTWMPRASGHDTDMGMGTGMDMIGGAGGEHDHDIFSFADSFH